MPPDFREHPTPPTLIFPFGGSTKNHINFFYIPYGFQKQQKKALY